MFCRVDSLKITMFETVVRKPMKIFSINPGSLRTSFFKGINFVLSVELVFNIFFILPICPFYSCTRGR